MLMMDPVYGFDAFHSKGRIKPSEPSFSIDEHKGLLVVFADAGFSFHDFLYEWVKKGQKLLGPVLH
jgi:hypothetical protein